MLNDDEQYYMERELTGYDRYDCGDVAPIEYITELADDPDEDYSGPEFDGWDEDGLDDY